MIIVKIAGGLGNQLFKYAAGRALSLKFNTVLKFDLTFFDQPKYHNALRLTKFHFPVEPAQELDWIKLVNRKGNKLIRRLKRMGIKFPPYYRKTHLIENDVMKLVNRKISFLDAHYYIEGWFGNENYFKNYREVLLNEFNMDDMLSKSNKILLHEIVTSNSVAVHIRRGDYLTNRSFNNLTTEYYMKAINFIKDKTDKPFFFFFSDDIQWVKNEFAFLDEAVFVEGNSEHESVFTTKGDIDDLMLMRSCRHNIIANSTFSWWAAWLNTNPDKIIVAPKIWYKNLSAQKKYERSNFVPEQWIKL